MADAALGWCEAGPCTDEWAAERERAARERGGSRPAGRWAARLAGRLGHKRGRRVFLFLILFLFYFQNQI